ncbi:MAG: HDIG domain-containing protein [Endomicrobium sp.]|jgi:putative nucleotidyltransferase with HDIG domain|nr:HDIG domain-containing protein [Endomicrobium sp.]
MNFTETIKHKIREYLILFARTLGERKHNKGPVTRNAKSIVSKEIKIPTAISFAITAVIICIMCVMGTGFDSAAFVSSLIFISTLAVFLIVQLREKEKETLKDSDAVVLMCILLIMGVLVLQISKEYVSPFIFPIGAFAAIAAMLLSVRIGVIYALLMSIFAGMLSDMRFDVFFVMFCSGFAIIINIERVRKRSDFISSGLKAAATSAVIVSMFYFLDAYDAKNYARILFYCVLNFAASVIIILTLMPFFEKLFSRVTNIKLIELSDFNNPLLKRLMVEAPGTYHHSLMTATIAEAAADAIGVNSLLARVGAYYHDVGKLKNPGYFIENQSGGVNPHDPLTPAMSSLILISHIKDGAALARKHNLDKEIIDCIEQHHGTTSIYFFYRKALEANPEASADSFRYPGPKPQTKAAAIVMIADSCEAAVRALEEPTAVRIQDVVEKIINNKFTDGQFSDCPITLKDLKNIRNSITASLISVYHARIEYKEDDSGN